MKHECMLSHFSCVSLFATLFTITCQALLSMGFSRKEHWSALPCPPLEDLSDPGIKPMSLMSPKLADGFFTTSSTWEAFIFPSSFFGHAAQLMKSYFPDQGSNLPPTMKVPSPNPWAGREFPM